MRARLCTLTSGVLTSVGIALLAVSAFVAPDRAAFGHHEAGFDCAKYCEGNPDPGACMQSCCEMMCSNHPVGSQEYADCTLQCQQGGKVPKCPGKDGCKEGCSLGIAMQCNGKCSTVAPKCALCACIVTMIDPISKDPVVCGCR